MVYLFIFSIIPMFGILLAFKDYAITDGVMGIFTSPFSGLKHFREFFGEYKFWRLVRNTLALSLLKLIFTFPVPIFFAIVVNELKNKVFKRFVQTASYLPYFISWVLVTGLFATFFSEYNGVVNEVLVRIGLIQKPIPLLVDPGLFYPLAVLSSIWKDTGWWTIIFLAAIASLDAGLYEAAEVDGAGRLKRIRHITLPGLKSTIVVVLILALGNLLGGGLSGSNFEQSYLMGNPMNSDTSEIIQKYTFSVGLSQGRFAYATAVGLIQSVISLFLITVSNFSAKKLTGNGII